MGDFCIEFKNLFLNYLATSLSCVGFLMNLLCSMAFIFSKDLKSNVFKYLLIKSLCDTLVFLRNIINFLSDSCGEDCFLTNTFEICVVNFILYFYLGRSLLLISMFCDIGASFNRLRLLANRLKSLDKIPFWFKIMAMCVYSFIFYLYVFTGKELCEKESTSNNKTKYGFFNASFQHTEHGKIIETTHSFIRDIWCLVLLASINITTLILTKRSLKRKRYIATRTEVSRADRAESRLTYMVFITSFIYIIGHCSLFIYYVPISLAKNGCFHAIVGILFYTSNSLNFFVYFSFNKHFKNYFKSISIKLISLISFNQFKINSLSETSN